LAEEFTIAPIRRIIKRVEDIRISENAAEAMRRAVGEISLKLAEIAVGKAKRDGRNTLLERDIMIAYSLVLHGEDDNEQI
jgi:histone H3/H4